jgi:CHASE2 domain-containing sensor protein
MSASMPKIFISYRRADSIAYAKLIYRPLVEQFGGDHVFFDIEKIDLGEEFARIIDERVARCDVLLAIIGPKWLTLVDDQGRRRLEQLDDYVRREIAVALSRNIRVIPVLVGGAHIPRSEDLPQELAALSQRNAHEVSDAHLDQDIEQLIAKLAGQKGFRQAFNALARRLRLRRVALALVPACALAMFFALWVSLFDSFALDTMIESYTMGLGSWFKKSPASDEVVLVAIDSDTERHFGKSFDKTWRREHARLIRALSSLGAKTIAFDMVLTEPSPYDDELIAAIQSAKRNGTAVIFGTRGKPSSIPAFEQAVTGLGHLCVGTRPRLWYASTAPLAVKKRQPQQILPGLPLLAAYPGPVKAIDDEHGLISVEDGNRLVKFSLRERVSRPQKACPALEKGDEVVQLIIEFRPRPMLRDRRHRYEHIAGKADGASDNRFKGKIVLVGQETERDTISVFHGLWPEERYGLEVHADTLSTLLQGIHIHPLNDWGQFFIMLGMGALGAAARFFRAFASPLSRRLYCAAVVGIYLGASVLLYVEYQVLTNTVYHISAFFIAYWAMGKAARRMGLWERFEHRGDGIRSSPAS